MAEQEELKIAISADVTDFVRNLGVATNLLEEFGQKGRQAIADLNKDFRTLGRDFVSGTKPIDTAQLTNKIKNLQAEVRNLKQQLIDFGKTTNNLPAPIRNTSNGIQQVEDSSRRARIAVYGLNQVVRDLPFGFIAISNNIPVLIDQFQALQQQEGSTRKALQAFSAGLVGAGGVSIALSAAVSLITTAVQKYGSLQKAFDALIGTTNSLKVAKESLNNEVVKSNANATIEIGKIEFLVRAIQDNTLSQEQRINAYKEFKKLAPGVIKDMTEENALTAAGALLLQQRSQQLIQYIRLKGQEGALIKLLEKSNEKRFQAELDFLTNVRNFSQGNIGLLDKIIQNFNLVNDPANFLGIKQFSKDIGDATTQSEFFEQVLQKIREQLLSFDPQLTGVEDYKKSLLEQLKTQREIQKQIKAQQREQDAASNQAIENEKRLLRQQIKSQEAQIKNIGLFESEPLALENAYQKLFNLKKQLETIDAKQITDASQRSQALLAIEQEFAANLSLIYIELRDKRIKATTEAAEAQRKANADFFAQADKDIEAYNNIDFGGVLRRSQEFFKQLRDDSKLSVEQLRDLAGILNNIVGGAISSLFNALENGANAFDAIGQSLKRLILQLVATVVQAAALAAILSLIPGAGAALGVVGSISGGTGNFGGLFRNFLGLSRGLQGGVAAPISGPGGFGLSGQVVFVQRGADLVGVLDRTNARIGRIG
jgi:hypothetical protein